MRSPIEHLNKEGWSLLQTDDICIFRHEKITIIYDFSARPTASFRSTKLCPAEYKGDEDIFHAANDRLLLKLEIPTDIKEVLLLVIRNAIKTSNKPVEIVPPIASAPEAKSTKGGGVNLPLKKISA